MTDGMTHEELIAVLEGAQNNWKRFPRLTLGYAIGLTVIDDNDYTTQCGRLLELHSPLQRGTGGVDEITYAAMRERFKLVLLSLAALGYYIPNPQEHEIVNSLLTRLRSQQS